MQLRESAVDVQVRDLTGRLTGPFNASPCNFKSCNFRVYFKIVGVTCRFNKQSAICPEPSQQDIMLKRNQGERWVSHKFHLCRLCSRQETARRRIQNNYSMMHKRIISPLVSITIFCSIFFRAQGQEDLTSDDAGRDESHHIGNTVGIFLSVVMMRPRSRCLPTLLLLSIIILFDGIASPQEECFGASTFNCFAIKN